MNRMADEAVRVDLRVDSVVGSRLALEIPVVSLDHKDSCNSAPMELALNEVPSLSPLESSWTDVEERLVAHFPSVANVLWRKVCAEPRVRQWALCWWDLKPVGQWYGKWKEGLENARKSFLVSRGRILETHPVVTRNKAHVPRTVPSVISSGSVLSSATPSPLRRTEGLERVNQPVASRTPVSKANPSVLKYLREIKVVSVRVDGVQSKVRIGSEIFYVQSMVSPELKLKLVGIGPRGLIFMDDDNVRYAKRISFE
jgi:hypothetical protein